MRRKFFVIFWLTLILTGIVCLFWRVEWVYSLPTPVPENYKNVNVGDHIALDWKETAVNTKPYFLHFFNPDCPCSRFNIPHFKSLVKEYGDRVNFAIVPISTKKISMEDIRERFDLDVPVLMNSDLAEKCGVYSTPQAAIVDRDYKLHYRGNYNRARYCADKETEYARIALEALVRNDSTQFFDQFALKAYGCRLPLCTSK